MTKQSLPFDHRPDPVVGAALRWALDPGEGGEGGEGGAAFVARVLARAEHVRAGTWDAVLARWARVGVAAAVTISLAAGYFLGRSAASATPGRVSVADALLAPATQAPEVEVVLASVIGN